MLSLCEASSPDPECEVKNTVESFPVKFRAGFHEVEPKLAEPSPG